MFHTFLGEKMSSGDACKNLVKKIAENTKLPYFSITPTFSICPEHGYISGEHFTCPQPNGGGEGRKEGHDGLSKSNKGMKQTKPVLCGKRCRVYSRVVGYFRPIQTWNDGKQEEFRNRLEYDEKKSIASQFKAAG